MDPRRSYETRPDLDSRRGTGHLRPSGARRLTYGPLLVSSRRGRCRSRLMVAAIVLLLIGMLAFAYIFVQVAFPH
jgi:hypothetical protein